jgi:hypothetical protein
VARCIQRFQERRTALSTELLSISSTLNVEYEKQCEERKVEEQKLIFGRVFENKTQIRGIGQETRPDIYTLDQIEPEKSFIINPEDAGLQRVATSESPHLMIFPKASDKREEMLPQYGYQCNNEKYNHVGLSTAKQTSYGLSFIPKCFETDQYANPNSKLNTYLKEDKQEEKSSSYIIRTSRILMKNQIGSMMEDVERWYGLIEPSLRVYRFGLFNFFMDKMESYIPTELRHASILLLLETLQDPKISPHDAVQNGKRKLLAFLEKSVIHRTQTYNYKIEDLREILEKNQYIDPRLFYHSLRDVYQLELLLFTKEKPTNQSAFYPCPPYYHTPMMNDDTYEQFVGVVLNPGGEFDGLEFPLCEPISFEKDGKRKMKNETNNTFHREFNMVLKHLYGVQYQSYYFSQQPTAQTLDALGRTQWLHFDEVSVKLVIPVHSMELPIRPQERFANTEQQIIEFLEQETGIIEMTATYDTQNRKTGIIVTKKKARYFFPLQVGDPDARLEMYQAYEKVARYITEYTYLAFSLYTKEAVNFQSFADNCFLINPDHVYPLASRYWRVRDANYLSDGRVIVTSQEMKTKLMYLLRQKYRTYREVLLSYQDFDYMPNYYTSLSDFTTQPNTLLIDRDTPSLSMQHGSFVIQQSATPYMLYQKLEEFNHAVWLCQPADSLEAALFICHHWATQAFNPLEKGTLPMLPHVKVIWTSDTTYMLDTTDPSEESFQHLVSVIPLESGTIYQALLPYRLT